MNYLLRGYVALVVCVAIGTAWFALPENGGNIAADSALTTSVPLVATVRSVPPQRVTDAPTPLSARTAPAAKTEVAPTQAVHERGFRDGDQVIAGFPQRQPTDQGTTDAASAQPITATAALTATVEPPPMTPD